MIKAVTMFIFTGLPLLMVLSVKAFDRPLTRRLNPTSVISFDNHFARLLARVGRYSR
jgi:hypothetical protein